MHTQHPTQCTIKLAETPKESSQEKFGRNAFFFHLKMKTNLTQKIKVAQDIGD